MESKQTPFVGPAIRFNRVAFGVANVCVSRKEKKEKKKRSTCLVQNQSRIVKKRKTFILLFDQCEAAAFHTVLPWTEQNQVDDRKEEISPKCCSLSLRLVRTDTAHFASYVCREFFSSKQMQEDITLPLKKDPSKCLTIIRRQCHVTLAARFHAQMFTTCRSLQAPQIAFHNLQCHKPEQRKMAWGSNNCVFKFFQFTKELFKVFNF